MFHYGPLFCLSYCGSLLTELFQSNECPCDALYTEKNGRIQKYSDVGKRGRDVVLLYAQVNTDSGDQQKKALSILIL